MVKLEGDQVDVTRGVSKDCIRRASCESDRKVLCLVSNKVLCGLKQSALLWYEFFSTTLLGMGFKLNPRDLCVAIEAIDGKQYTIVWHVDDSKESYEGESAVQ